MMKNKRFSGKDITLLVILLILLIAVGYYMGFYKPLKAEIAQTNAQCAEIETNIASRQAELDSMDMMQAEVKAVLDRPADEITEIAPYDNSKVIMNELNNILSSSLDYRLSFAEPKIEKDGMVRRTVEMGFNCENYSAARAILEKLAGNHWRCLISNLSMNTDNASSEGGVQANGVNVSASIVFFESTQIG